MVSSKYTMASLALAVMAPSALAAPTHSNSDSRFSWGPCEFEDGIESSVRYECSNFTVPLDYLDDSANRTLGLQVTRVPATNGESQGSIFFNFGGPGIEVRKTLAALAEQILIITEGKFDLVGWDPRGVAANTFNCYNDTERAVIVPKHRLLEDIAGPEDPPRLAHLWASVENLANNCRNSEENAPEMGELVGTGYTARDLMQLKDALDGPDALLNYWGISYGTVLGVTVAALFPDKMGRVMLDGNVNIPQWFNGYDTVWWSDSDKALFDYFDRCVRAGPELCRLAARNESAAALNDKMYELMDELRLSPIPLGGATILDTSALKLALRLILYGNSMWPAFAVVLDELFKPVDQRNLTLISSVWVPITEGTDVNKLINDESQYGILCSDKNIRAETFEEIFAVSEELAGVSRALGEVGNSISYPCARWPWHAKGSYESDWNETIETKNPMLFVGTKYDPVTPIRNAYNNSEVFVGSGVFTHDGIGHGVTGHPSLCTAKAIRAYFQEGKLPAEDLKCTADFDAFDITKTWVDSYLPELGWE